MATKKKAAPKPKKKIAKEDLDVAKNLGVDVSEPKKAAKVDLKKFRELSTAVTLAGGADKFKAEQESIRAAKGEAESARYQQTLARMAGVPGIEQTTAVELDPNRKSRRTRKRNANPVETSPVEKSTTPFVSPSEKEMDLRYSDQGKFLVPETTRPGLSEGLQKHIAETGLTNLNTPMIDAEPTPVTPEEREARALQSAAKFERIHKSAIEATQRRSATNASIAEQAKRRASMGIPLPGDLGAATGAALQPLPRQEAPTYQQTIDEGTQARRAAKLEKARPVIAESTGKDIEDIGYAGDEPYVVDEETGRTDSINSHALRMAQRDYDLAKQTGKEVNGIGATRKRPTILNGKEALIDEPRPRPEKIEDIYDTAHRSVAYQARHLGLSEEQILGAPSNSRRSYEAKANTLMEVAKQKAGSMRQINVANEVQPNHKGWEDENGNLHKFTFQKDGKVSPMSLPSDFTRTAVPISAVANPDYDTATLMGAEQVDDTDSDNPRAGKPISGGLDYGDRDSLKGAVTSHEGYTLHTDDVWRKIAHPIPEEARIHVADKVAGRVVLANESKARKASSKSQRALMDSVSGGKPNDRTNTGGRGGNSNLAPIDAPTGPNYDARTMSEFDPETTTNPMPPKISTQVLVSNRGENAEFDDIRSALAAKKIKPEQASALNPNWDRENNKVVIPQTGEKPRSEMSRAEKVADTKKRRAAMDVAKAKLAKQPTAAQYRSKQFVEARPLSLDENEIVSRGDFNADKGYKPQGKGRVLSSAYLKAQAEVTGERHSITRELPEKVKTWTVDKERGPSLKMEEVTGNRAYNVMVDERGPVKEGEIIHRMINNAATSQALPERSEVRAALADGHITSEESHELRTLDQFSKYRTQTAAGPVPRAKDMSDIKYSRLYEPVTAKEAAVEHPGHKTPYTEGEPVVSAPARTRRKKAAAGPNTPISSQLRSYIGSPVELKAEDLPAIRGQRGSVREGSGREFSNWQNQPDRIVQHDFEAGDLIQHATHGVGKVSRILEAGSILPGTEKFSRAGKLKKGTGTQITEPHAEINFGGKVGVKHLPLTENISAAQREAAAAVTPATTPGFGGDIKTRNRLIQKPTQKPAKVGPTMEKLREVDILSNVY